MRSKVLAKIMVLIVMLGGHILLLKDLKITFGVRISINHTFLGTSQILFFVRAIRMMSLDSIRIILATQDNMFASAKEIVTHRNTSSTRMIIMLILRA
jgi:hypothetical protein